MLTCGWVGWKVGIVKRVNRVTVNYEIPIGMRSRHRLQTVGGSWMEIRVEPPRTVVIEEWSQAGDGSGPSSSLDWIQDTIETIRKEAIDYVW